MLIATFGPASDLAGTEITREGEGFVLEGRGAISASDIMAYDRVGQLIWANDGARAWVGANASQPGQVDAARATAHAGHSRETSSQTMNLTCLTLGDWVVVGGFVALLLGTSLAWYSSSGVFVEYRVIDEVGWAFAAGWFSWLIGLGALMIVILSSGVTPQLQIDFRGRAPLILLGLGALASFIVSLGLVTRPTYDESFGIGIFVSLGGAAAVAAGGLLKRKGTTPTSTPLAAALATNSAAESASVQSIAEPAELARPNAPRPPSLVPVPPSGAQAPRTGGAPSRSPLWKSKRYLIPLGLGGVLLVVLLGFGLPLLSPTLSPQEIYQKHAGSVVVVQATLSTQGALGQPSGSTQVLGTGFVVSEDGYILTNAHVVSESGQAASTVDVIFRGSASQEITVRGTVVGADESTDVALIKVDPDQTPRLKPIPLGDSSKTAVGEQVVAIGNPQGLDLSLSSGVVSATNRDLESPNGTTIIGGIQTDAAINPGSSGGPLIDSTGHVIGINEQITSQSGGNEGIGFAVPINIAIGVMERMRADVKAH